ncbi:MAG: RNA 2',3'-cyclic phosphodiesterase [Pseudomonadota bacterium]
MGLTRTFVALGLPDPIPDALEAIAERVPGGRSVDGDNLHVTLAFLGDVDSSGLVDVHDALNAIQAAEFSLLVEGLGLFGRNRPRSLWAGVRNTPELTFLQSKVARAAHNAGVDLTRRRFVPHITLARFSGGPETPELQRFIAGNAGLSLGAVSVQSFGLYASHLTSGGAFYEELSRYPLAAM